VISLRAEKLVRKLGGAKPMDVVVKILEPALIKTRFDAVTRSQAISLDHAGAAIDPEFKKLATQADEARDAGRWGEAEYHYWRALGLYPFHSGYRIQYAHVIKEQGKLDWAEVHYRSALAEGAERDLVDEHLLFVAHQNRSDYVSRPQCDLSVAPFDAPPSFHDIQTLAWLFWHDAEINAHDTLALLRKCETNREVVLAMASHDRFVERNRPFLEILRG
jgi:hypothetical protein